MSPQVPHPTGESDRSVVALASTFVLWWLLSAAQYFHNG